MCAKLRFGDPVVISYGPTLEEVGWGPYQFPSIARTDAGELVAGYHVVDDTTEAYGLERGWSISRDEGKTWEAIPREDYDKYKALSGLKLPSGRRIRGLTPRPVQIDEELRQQLLKKIGRRRFALGIEDAPDGLFEKDCWHFAVSEPGSAEETVISSKLDFPGLTVGVNSNAIIPPFAFGTPRLAPDGSVWFPFYQHGRNPENLGFTSYYACYYLRSTDECKSFKLMSWIQYLPDTNEFPNAFTTEGFCEPDIGFMPDGSMITIMRTGSFTPSYIARTTDGGKSWSKPVKFDRCGVLPHILTLGCGVTIASYGRPGLFVRATEDPAGMKWDEPYELMPYEEFERSCYYTDLLPLDDHRALMVYSHFTTPAPDGKERKAILVREIIVEK